MDVLKKLFEQHFRAPVERGAAAAGPTGRLGTQDRPPGQRRNSARSAFCMACAKRMWPFWNSRGIFAAHGLPVPEIYAEDLSHGAYLEEDLGDTTLFEFLSNNRAGEHIAPQVVEAYRKVVAVLPRFQVEAGRDLNYKVCYPRASFDRQSIAWDLNYFKYYFLRLAGIPFNEQALEDDFGRLTKFLLSADRDYFLYRDFQSRNIMLRDGRSVFSGLSGRTQGRAAIRHRFSSVRRQGRSAAGAAPATARSLSRRAGRFHPLDREAFMQHYYAYVYVRIMQALGAYGFRGFYERKSLFLQSVPYALKNLRWLLHHVELPIALPALMEAFQSMLASEKLQSVASEAENLVVRIFSFSFHRGLPQGRSRTWRRVCLRCAQPAESGARGALQAAHGQRCAGDRISRTAGERASVPGQRHVAGGCQREHLSAPRLQEPDGIVRLHRRPASLGLSRGAIGQASAGQERRGGGGAPPGAGEDGQMKAMILAAGLGTRLRPLTDDRPKALVEVGGHTLLEITLARLRAVGVREVIVNVHHFAEMIVDYLKANGNFGMRIEISREEVLLDTGGGLKKAAHFFLEDSSERTSHSFCTMSTSSAPSISGAWCNFTRTNGALATLAVQDRETSRYLLFDEQLQLCGRRSGPDETKNPFDPPARMKLPRNRKRRLRFPVYMLFHPVF